MMHRVRHYIHDLATNGRRRGLGVAGGVAGLASHFEFTVERTDWQLLIPLAQGARGIQGSEAVALNKRAAFRALD